MQRSERIMISVTPRGKKALTRLAKATSKPISTVAGELIDEAAPMLESLANAAESVKEKKGDAYRAVALALAESQLQSSQLSVDFHSSLPAPSPSVSKKRRK
jgi:hypothetical protein